MAGGQVAVNSSEVASILSYMVNSCSILESDLSSKIPGKFQCLVDLGFLSTSVSKIEEQIKSISSTYKNIIAEISSHLDEIEQIDDQLGSGFRSGYGSVYSGGGSSYYGGGGSYGGGASGSNTNISKIDDGKKINVQKLIECLPLLDDESKLNLIKFIDIKKNEGTTLVDLLFNAEKTEELFVLIKDAFKDSIDLSEATIDDYVLIKKALLEMICTNDIDYKELNDNTIISAKEYLVNISKQNNISVSDLLVEDEYRDVLKTSLVNLYKGEVNIDMAAEMVDNYRKYIDKVAQLNNITSEELLTQHIELIL